MADMQKNYWKKIEDECWHHFATRRINGVDLMYVDGVLISSKESTQARWNSRREKRALQAVIGASAREGRTTTRRL